MLSNPISFRRLVAGISLIGFPVLGLASTIVGTSEGTDTSPGDLYGLAVQHGDGMVAAALLFMASAVLIVPALGGMLHLLQGRGVVLGHLGGALVLVLAFAHMGYGTWLLMVSRVPAAGDQAAMVAFLDRASLATDVLVWPLMIGTLGLLLLGIALYRARLLPVWALGVMVLALLIDFTPLTDEKAGVVLVWALGVAPFAYLAIRVLRMSDGEWAAQAATAHPVASRPHRGARDVAEVGAEAATS